MLIDLLSAASSDLQWQAEELLLRIAGEKAPQVSLGTTEKEREAWQAAWAKWLGEHGDKVDLSRLDEKPPFLNLTLVCEMHGDKIWEVGRDGKVRWTEAGFGCGSIIYADGKLWLMSEKGELILAKPNADKFEVLSRAKVLAGPVRAHLALSGGLLYCRDNKQLVAWKVKK